jgi:acetolactate synthase-1/2/3 large subunit
MMPNGASIAIESLRKEKVKDAFGIPGGSIIDFYDKILDSGINHILMRHEQGAAHAAEGYARASGRPGVCIATSEPGSTNLVTGIADAFLDSTPIVAITGQVTTRMIGKDAFQEADIVGIVSSITKLAYQVRSVEEIPIAFKRAFKIATGGRAGPVLVDLPKDVQQAVWDNPVYPDEIVVRNHVTREPDPLKVKEISRMICESERPLLLCGGGVVSANGQPEVVSLCEQLSIPVITTFMGKGSIPEDHPLSLGVVGMHGRAEANLSTYETDLMLAVGVRFSDRSTSVFSKFATQAKIVHVDIDEVEIGKNIKPHYFMISDAKLALRAIYERVSEMTKKKGKTDWSERIKALKESYASYYLKDEKGKMLPGKILRILREELPRQAILTTGVGQNQMWAGVHFNVYSPRTFISSGGLGTMGFGFPASIGAKVARPDVPVFCVDGDGSFLMTSQNLATVTSYKIPVNIVVLNNEYLGMVKQWQDMLYGKRLSAVRLGRVPEMADLAKSFGAEGTRIGSYDEFRSAIRKALRSDCCNVIDVPIDPDAKALPMVPPGKTLKEMVM